MRGGAVGACSGRTARIRGSLACAVSASSAPLHPYSLRAGVGSTLAPTSSPAARRRNARSPRTAEQMETEHTEDGICCHSVLIGNETHGGNVFTVG